MPPFVGAVAMQLLFGRSGSVNLLLNDAFGFTIPFMDGLNGVIFVESLHYFPFILLNLVVSLRNIDGAMEEVGAEPRRLGLAALPAHRLSARRCPATSPAPSLVFVKVFDDLGTPLVLGTYQHARAAGLPAHHLGRHRGSDRLRDQRRHGRRSRSPRSGLSARHPQGPRLCDAAARRQRRCSGAQLTPWQAVARLRLDRRWCCCSCSRRTSASCCMSLSQRLELQRPARRLHPRALRDACSRSLARMIGNTLLYCGARRAASTSSSAPRSPTSSCARGCPGRQLLDLAASAALAIPGVVLGDRLPARLPRPRAAVHADARSPPARSPLVIAYAVRRLPYALRSCMAALQQLHVSLEEAAENLGASEGAHRAAHRRAADGRRHPRRLRHQLHHRRGRALGDDRARRRRRARRRCPTASTSTCRASPAAARARRSA